MDGAFDSWPYVTLSSIGMFALADETYTAAVFDLLNVLECVGKSFHYSAPNNKACVQKGGGERTL